LITVATKYLIQEKAKRQPYYTDAITPWIASVARIFTEENVHYAVDRAGGVHFARLTKLRRLRR
jgi:hypothetical protein